MYESLYLQHSSQGKKRGYRAAVPYLTEEVFGMVLVGRFVSVEEPYERTHRSNKQRSYRYEYTF